MLLNKGLDLKDEEPGIEYKRKYQQQILGVNYEVQDMCQNCVYNHTINKKLDWEIDCTPLRKDKKQYSLKSENEYIAQMKENIVLFAKYELDLELREFQKEILLCTSRSKVLRLPRQQGKSVSLAVAIQHYVLCNPKKQVLLLAHSDSKVKDLFKEINNYINESILLKSIQIPQRRNKYYKSAPDYEFTFLNGQSVIGKSTGNPDQARGKSADLIVMDEVQYMSKEAIETITPITGAKQETCTIAQSTPSDKGDYFYQLTQSPSVKEIHYRFQELETYNPKLDQQMRDQLPSYEQYVREVLAEFTATDKNVFPSKIIDPNIEEYSLDSFDLPIPRGIYTIGVDWNESNTGVHIVVLKQIENDKVKLCNFIVISPEKFTQINAVNALIELNEIYDPKFIATDIGYGNTQLQYLYKYADEHPESGLKYKIVPVDFNGYFDLNLSSGQIIRQKTKPFMVSITSRYLEQNKLVLPKSLDKRGKLIDQMRKYEIVDISEGNVPRYSKGNVHTLEQFMLQLLFMWKLSPEGTDVQLYDEAVETGIQASKAVIGKQLRPINYNSKSVLDKKELFRKRSYIKLQRRR